MPALKIFLASSVHTVIDQIFENKEIKPKRRSLEIRFLKNIVSKVVITHKQRVSDSSRQSIIAQAYVTSD